MTRTAKANTIPVTANALTRSILDLLAFAGFKAWRNSTGCLPVQASGNARGRFVRFGEPGSPDILAIEPGSGRLWCIEVKAGRDTIKPHQQMWLDDAAEHGAVVIVARSLDDVVDKLEAMKA